MALSPQARQQQNMRRQSGSGQQQQQQFSDQQSGYGQSFGQQGTLPQHPVGISPHQHQSMGQPVPYYASVRPGFGFSPAGPQAVYWAPAPGGYAHGWMPQHMGQRPQLAYMPSSPGHPGAQHIQQPHLIATNHLAGTVPQSPQRPPPPYQQQVMKQAPAPVSPTAGQQMRPRFLIPGNGVRSSSIGSIRRGSVGSVRSQAGDDTLEGMPSLPASATQLPPTGVPQQTPGHERSISQGSGQLSQSQPEPTSPARVASPIQAPCAHFLKSGTCAFGDRCKFAHTSPMAKLNSLGLPLREGQPECQFFTKHMRCGFGASCKYHHPEPPPGMHPHWRQMPSMVVQPGMAPAGGYHPQHQLPQHYPPQRMVGGQPMSYPMYPPQQHPMMVPVPYTQPLMPAPIYYSTSGMSTDTMGATSVRTMSSASSVPGDEQQQQYPVMMQSQQQPFGSQQMYQGPSTRRRSRLSNPRHLAQFPGPTSRQHSGAMPSSGRAMEVSPFAVAAGLPSSLGSSPPEGLEVTAAAAAAAAQQAGHGPHPMTTSESNLSVVTNASSQSAQPASELPMPQLQPQPQSAPPAACQTIAPMQPAGIPYAIAVSPTQAATLPPPAAAPRSASPGQSPAAAGTAATAGVENGGPIGGGNGGFTGGGPGAAFSPDVARLFAAHGQQQADAAAPSQSPAPGALPVETAAVVVVDQPQRPGAGQLQATSESPATEAATKTPRPVISTHGNAAVAVSSVSAVSGAAVAPKPAFKADKGGVASPAPAVSSAPAPAQSNGRATGAESPVAADAGAAVVTANFGRLDVADAEEAVSDDCSEASYKSC
mmetsp:Transcript_7048/g.20622  ORF Transcript_7048/g.20622 Transcript_7048/m.20622 type:complete len:817 (-) Transcript_7048:1898-4348(-)|eukprot:CAMPEP_0206135966 /NCGR_PEP_ID=MMETSP1473-20131121/1206_1 /ASSEMBLY_ACC=CAM_ASM_001109 /TAXON_ID=1461547 /ORGANISM="Stichococcus sp, Strain RCC1054" /LENGTH=816 /DNA_ID=CAMNT_0053528143 /DNA_START=490 /DNA_END=2940 /DNA_ORIENTATION=+